MEIITDGERINRLAMARGVLETELARSMYNVFNSPPLIDRLRDLCGLAIEQIVGFGTLGTVETAVRYTGALQEAGKNLAVWRGRASNIMSLKHVLAEKDTWSAADCSDLIRLFGGVIESEELQKAKQVGADVASFEKAQRVDERGQIWGPHRARDKKGFKEVAESPHTAAGRAAMLKFRRDPEGFSGIQITGLTKESTVKKIDFVFGLPEGCDISGTTADSIFFIRHVNKFIEGLPEMISPELVPVVQLLPVATMVSQAHHTLLECALTLTLNHIFRYSVGFYTTLMPFHTESQVLKPIFEAFEKDARNKHVLCYREPRGVTATMYADPSEVRKFKEASKVGMEFMLNFASMPWPPTKKDVFNAERFCMLPH
jgi:hypothetical protein